VFIDQPVGTGFSYGKNLNTDMKVGSKEFIKFILKFYDSFPEFKERDLYLTGESYAGKYLALFTYDILMYNQDTNKTTQNIPIKATTIGDPYVTPVLQRSVMWKIPEALAYIDSNNMDQISALIQKCQVDQT